jgi:tetratricopeptide (TPR) repeat protein
MSTVHCLRGWVVVLLLLCSTGRGEAQELDHSAHLLGKVDFRVSCSPEARVEFNRAVALLHHMTYPQARQAFERTAKIDPGCAMAHWGVAMTLFQPLWPTRPGPAELRAGWEAIHNANALRPPTERERLFVRAAEAFFQDPQSTDYWGRIRRWEKAMEQVYNRFPEDPEAAAFFALAHLATAPSDRISLSHSERAARLLLTLYRANPDHPGAMHYLVHANDVPGRERESIEIIRKYESAAPRNPHALHMPTHIYTRLGDWEGVIRGNLKAAEAALEHPAGDRGQFVWDEFPHAIEYLVYAYLQKGEDEKARGQLRRLQQTEKLEPSFKTAFHLASTQARYALERRDWHEAAAVVPRGFSAVDWDRFPWPEAVSWFAHGLGAARGGDVPKARTAAKRLEELEKAASAAREDLFTRNIRVLRLAVSAWQAHADLRERAASVALMTEAAELEASTPKHAVTPAPTLPAYELLGDLLLEQGQPGRALVAYRRSLELYPGRFNSLRGAARAARSSGDAVLARTFYQQLLSLVPEGTRKAPLDEARSSIQEP